VPAAEGGQAGVRDLAVLGEKLLVDADQVPLARGVELRDSGPKRLELLRAIDLWDLS
jgi:hypothetical protein